MTNNTVEAEAENIIPDIEADGGLTLEARASLFNNDNNDNNDNHPANTINVEMSARGPSYDT